MVCVGTKEVVLNWDRLIAPVDSWQVSQFMALRGGNTWKNHPSTGQKNRQIGKLKYFGHKGINTVHGF